MMDAAYSHINKHNHRGMLVQYNTASKIGHLGVWELGRSGHAGHLTGHGGQLWREHW